MEKKERALKKEFTARGRCIFISIFVIGLFVHGSRFFNEELFFDDVNHIGRAGATYTSGRYFIQVLYKLKKAVMGSHINAKGYEAVVTMTLFALMAWLIARDLQIRRKGSLILLCAVLITTPYVISLLGYTYTAGFYNIGMLMGLSAASLISRSQKGLLWRLLLSILLLGLSMAIYQTTLCLFTAYLTLLLIQETIRNTDDRWRAFFRRCLPCLASCLGGAAFYYFSNKAILAAKGLEMTTYKSLNTMGQFTASQMLQRIYLAYKEFLIPSAGHNYSLYYTAPIRVGYWLTLAVLAGFGVFFLVRSFREKHPARACQLLLLFALAPAAINSVFLTADTDKTNIYSLMTFAEVILFVCLIFCGEYALQNLCLAGGRFHAWHRYLCIAAMLPVLYVSIYFGYTANVCYTRASIQFEQAVGYFNRLVARIQSTEGYQTGMRVAWYNALDKNSESYEISIFNDLYRIAPYDHSHLLEEYDWKTFMKIYCGFSAKSVRSKKSAEIEQTEEYQNMPHYPDAGSIKIIDGVVVVKF